MSTTIKKKSKALVFILLFFCYTDVAIHATLPANSANTYIEDVCALPAPSNLHKTASTATSIAVSWNPVAGSAGYWIKVTQVSNGNTVLDTAIPGTSYNITGLQSGTLYRIDVSSVCPVTGEKGGTSTIEERTDFIIIQDIIVEHSGSYIPVTGCSQFSTANGLIYRFNATQDGSPYMKKFEMHLNSSSNNPSDLTVNLKYFEWQSANSSNDRWSFTNHLNQIPYDSINNNATAAVPVKSLHEVRIYHSAPDPSKQPPTQENITGDQNNLVLKLMISRVTGMPNTIEFCVEDGPSNVSHSVELLVPGKPNGLVKSNTTTIQFAPNPFSGTPVFMLDNPALDQSTLKLYDLEGREVLRKDIDPGLTTVEIEEAANLRPGLYLARFESPEGTQTFKVIKSQ